MHTVTKVTTYQVRLMHQSCLRGSWPFPIHLRITIRHSCVKSRFVRAWVSFFTKNDTPKWNLNKSKQTGLSWINWLTTQNEGDLELFEFSRFRQLDASHLKI